MKELLEKVSKIKLELYFKAVDVMERSHDLNLDFNDQEYLGFHKGLDAFEQALIKELSKE